MPNWSRYHASARTETTRIEHEQQEHQAQQLMSAIVLGVGPGIGAAVARRWAAEGYRVACVCRSKDKANAIASDIGGVSTAPPTLCRSMLALIAAARLLVPQGATGWSCDVTDAEALQSTLADAERALGPPEMLCYNAGNGVWKKPLEITAAELEQTWRTNCAGLLTAASSSTGWGFILLLHHQL